MSLLRGLVPTLLRDVPFSGEFTDSGPLWITFWTDNSVFVSKTLMHHGIFICKNYHSKVHLV